MTMFSAATLLFLVMDPFGNIALFLTALKDVPQERHKRIILRELLIALIVLVFFLFMGRYILQLLHISEPSLTIAGGIILFLIALKMIFPARGRMFDELEGEPFVVPLAIPLVAGPSAMASLLFISSREPGRWPEWLVALLLAWFVTGIILLLASNLRRILKQRGLIAMERLMGMILTAIAVQMLLTGIKEALVS